MIKQMWSGPLCLLRIERTAGILPILRSKFGLENKVVSLVSLEQVYRPQSTKITSTLYEETYISKSFTNLIEASKVRI